LIEPLETQPMYYEPDQAVNPVFHDHVKAVVAPRPIGWISSISAAGVANLAPYSFFNLLGTGPAIIGFGSHGRKDSLVNIEQTGEFVCNVATFGLREAVNGSSAQVGPEVDEFALLGLETLPSVRVRPPRVKAAPAHLECVYLQSLPLPTLSGATHDSTLVLGQVVAVHVDDRFVRNGRIDAAAMQPLARLGYYDFAAVDRVFEVGWPDGYAGIKPIERLPGGR
jgi:flavin reductase (DIM6/NTAB) family NADH-FMN oxidoreductase RutF